VRWAFAAVCVVGISFSGRWALMESTVLRDNFGGDGTSYVEAPGSEESAREFASKRCFGRTVGDLARKLGTPDSKNLVAAAVAVESGNPPVTYKMCVRLLRD
jgi:hypothetical protein